MRFFCLLVKKPASAASSRKCLSAVERAWANGSRGASGRRRTARRRRGQRRPQIRSGMTTCGSGNQAQKRKTPDAGLSNATSFVVPVRFNPHVKLLTFSLDARPGRGFSCLPALVPRAPFPIEYPSLNFSIGRQYQAFQDSTIYRDDLVAPPGAGTQLVPAFRRGTHPPCKSEFDVIPRGFHGPAFPVQSKEVLFVWIAS